jgi:hypothetical protein
MEKNYKLRLSVIQGHILMILQMKKLSRLSSSLAGGAVEHKMLLIFFAKYDSLNFCCKVFH